MIDDHFSAFPSWPKAFVGMNEAIRQDPEIEHLATRKVGGISRFHHSIVWTTKKIND